MIDDSLLGVTSIAFGLVTFAFVVAFRRGRVRSRARWYFDPDQPLPLRHAPFISWAGALFMVSAGMVILVAPMRGSLIPDIVVAIGIGLALLASALAVYWTFRPAEWMKPEWLREEEKRRRDAFRNHGC